MKLLRKGKGKLLLLFLLLNCTCLLAQKTITGIVTDNAGKPVEGATVAIKGSTQRSLTNDKGMFSINVASGNAVLVISHIGMTRREMKVGDQNSLSITMMPEENTNLDDVVVVGYNTQKRSQTTGAVATIKAAQLEDVPAPNIAGALRGRMAGLGVSAISGRPGASISLNVRNSAISEQGGLYGATTEPLYVIDNMIVGKSTFDNLDPSMVEDITILKDASAAIYGAAGAKGVILITTKRGKAGPPKLSYNGYYGTTDATRKPEMLSAYEHAKLLNDGYRINNIDTINLFSEKDLDYLKNLNYKSWFDEIWQASITQRHNLSVSGGSDRMTFFVGGAYQNENANYAGMKQDKYTLRSGLTAKLISGVRAEVNFNVDSRIRYSKNGTSENDQAFLEALIQVPRWVPISIDGKFVNNNNSQGNNPLGQIESGFYRSSKSRGYGINASLVYQPESGFLKGLTARLQAAQSANGGRNDEYRPKYFIYNFQRFGNNSQLYTNQLTATSSQVTVLGGTNSRLIQSMDESSSMRIFFTLQYAKKIGRHDFNIIAGGEQSRSKGSGLEAYWQDQQIPNFDYYWAFTQAPIVSNPSISESTKRSFFGRFSYNYGGKYTVEGITRFDASSNFAKNNIWGVFPTVGLGWLVSEENFFKKNVKFINYFKLRANMGLTGDDRVSSRLWQDRYRVNAQSYLYNETLTPGLRPVIIPNPDITWEKKKTINVGAEISLLNNKLSLGVDLFSNHIYDAFDKGNDQNFPMYAGFTAPVVNYQVRYAWGSEFSIGYNHRVGKNLNLKASMNFSFGNSVIDRMFYNRYLLWERMVEEMVTTGLDPRTYNGNNYGLITEGMFRNQDEVDAFLSKNPGYTIDGAVPQPGWLYFKDVDGDGIITDRDKTTMFKTIDSKFGTGMQLGVSYKSFALNVNIGASFGGKVFYDTKARRSNPTPQKNVPAFWTDRWSEANPNGKFPRYDDPSMVAGWESTFWAVDGTTIRVNDMSIVYAVPPAVAKKVGLSNARLLITGNNLWVLKNPLKYKDPYSSYIYDYPTLRTMSVGLSVGL
ncbi:MAG: SusC/RagA family TonB-linked outer membrane protein [Bacteroidota bacterium]